MSFSFSAVGTKEEVAAQLAKVDVYGNAIGEEARVMVMNAISSDTAQTHSPDYELRYTVQASGHSGGGSPLSLNLQVTGTYVPKVSVPVVPDGNEQA